MLFAVIIFVVLVGIYVNFRWTHRRLIHEAEKLPSYFKRWPLIGSALQVIGNESLTRTIRYSSEYLNKYPGRCSNVCIFWAGPLPYYFLNNSEDIAKVLSLYIGQGEEIENLMKICLVPGLLAAPVEHWKLTRKHMTPVFHPSNCDMLMPIYNQNVRELVSLLSKHVDNGPVDILKPSVKFTLRTILYLIYGLAVQFDLKSTEFQRLVRATEILSDAFAARLSNIFLRSDLIFSIIYRNELKEFRESMKQFLAENEKLFKNKERNGGTREITTVVDAYRSLIDSHPYITLKHFVGEVYTMISAGTDSTSNVLALCILALAQHPELQEKLYKEVMSEVGHKDDLSVHDLSRLTYLDQVFKETLRWFSIAPIVTKQVLKDTKLSTCTIPAGTTVYLNLSALNKNPKTFSEPYKFDPEHFSLSNSLKLEKYSFIPFSAGPRNCIAKRFAEIFFKVVVAHLVRNFKFTTNMDIAKIKIKYNINLTSAESVLVSLHNRM